MTTNDRAIAGTADRFRHATRPVAFTSLQFAAAPLATPPA
jgi:hypothetical protein